MDIYKAIAIFFLIALGVIVVFLVIFTVIKEIIRNIDYKRQIQGKRPERKFKGKINYDKNESSNDLQNELNVDEAARGRMTRDQFMHGLK